MAKLKDKILNALKRGDELEATLEFLSKSQENLLKNYLNPAINEKDRDNILQNYSNLQNIGQSLYRFDTLKSENYLADAQEEKENIENVVLITATSGTVKTVKIPVMCAGLWTDKYLIIMMRFLPAHTRIADAMLKL